MQDNEEHDDDKQDIEKLTYLIIQAAIEVHRLLGPGLMERVYEMCLLYELELRGIKVERQRRLPLIYKGKRLGDDLIIDVLVEGLVVLELKAVPENHPRHHAQALSYLKLSGLRHGLVLNFGLDRLTDGVQSVING